jgi:hypothetical protein
MGVEFLGESADANLLLFGAVGKREWVKTASFVVTGVIANTKASAGSKRIDDMNAVAGSDVIRTISNS